MSLSQYIDKAVPMIQSNFNLDEMNNYMKYVLSLTQPVTTTFYNLCIQKVDEAFDLSLIPAQTVCTKILRAVMYNNLTSKEQVKNELFNRIHASAVMFYKGYMSYVVNPTGQFHNYASASATLPQTLSYNEKTASTTSLDISSVQLSDLPTMYENTLTNSLTLT